MGTFGIYLCENVHKLILNILILIPSLKKEFILFPVATFLNMSL